MSEREPYRRNGGGMDLPAGKTCADCVHCRRCTLMFGHIPEDEACDWLPSRFRERRLRLLACWEAGSYTPPGYALVPMEPTEEMETANAMYGDTPDWWDAAITAAPEPGA